MNVTVPEGLRAEMDSLSHVDGLNWSKVAQEAFQRHITILKLKQEGNDMQSGISRLKASKATNTAIQRAQGYAEGKKWALDVAEYDQLQRVVALDENGGLPAQSVDSDVPRILAAAISGDSCTWSETTTLMDQLFGVELPTDECIEGFMEACSEVLAQVD